MRADRPVDTPARVLHLMRDPGAVCTAVPESPGPSIKCGERVVVNVVMRRCIRRSCGSRNPLAVQRVEARRFHLPRREWIPDQVRDDAVVRRWGWRATSLQTRTLTDTPVNGMCPALDAGPGGGSHRRARSPWTPHQVRGTSCRECCYATLHPSFLRKQEPTRRPAGRSAPLSSAAPRVDPGSGPG